MLAPAYPIMISLVPRLLLNMADAFCCCYSCHHAATPPPIPLGGDGQVAAACEYSRAACGMASALLARKIQVGVKSRSFFSGTLSTRKRFYLHNVINTKNQLIINTYLKSACFIQSSCNSPRSALPLMKSCILYSKTKDGILYEEPVLKNFKEG